MFSRFALLLTLFIATTANAAEGSREANFDYPESKNQLANLIKYPDKVTGKVSLILSCVSRIQPSGKMKETGCYQNNQYESVFAATVVKAAKKARMNPAIVNGRPSEIYLQFRIEFLRESEVRDKDKDEDKEEDKDGDDDGKAAAEQFVYLYANPGYEENVLAYGFEHVAGQRVIGKNEPWNDACPNHANYTVLVRAHLSEEGKAENPTIEFTNGLRPIETCLTAIKRTIVASAYTPATSEGVPVPSTYIEFFGN